MIWNLAARLYRVAFYTYASNSCAKAAQIDHMTDCVLEYRETQEFFHGICCHWPGSGAHVSSATLAKLEMY